jgi:hypothetical protein
MGRAVAGGRGLRRMRQAVAGGSKVRRWPEGKKIRRCPENMNKIFFIGLLTYSIRLRIKNICQPIFFI